jgi:hypothetical protein
MYTLCINDVSTVPADDTRIYATETHERRVLCRVRRSLTAVNSWCECRNIKINEGRTGDLFLHKTRVPDDVLQLNGRDIPFVNNVTYEYLGVIFDRRRAWRHHIESTVAKALSTYVRTYSLFKSGCLSTNIKLTLYKALIRSVMTNTFPTCEHAAGAHLLKLKPLQNRVYRAI